MIFSPSILRLPVGRLKILFHLVHWEHRTVEPCAFLGYNWARNARAFVASPCEAGKDARDVEEKLEDATTERVIQCLRGEVKVVGRVVSNQEVQ